MTMQTMNNPMPDATPQAAAPAAAPVMPAAQPAPKKGGLSPLILGVVAVVLLLVVAVAVVLLNQTPKVGSSEIDQVLTEMETSLQDTYDIEQQLSDIPDNFLEAESASQSDVDTLLTELDTQLAELDGLENDFVFTDTEAGF